MASQILRTFGVLRRQPRFAGYWAAQLLSLMGDQITLIALSWFVLQTTGSGTLTAGILVALELPAILTGMLAGALVDRIQPRPLIFLDNALRMVLVALIPLLFFLGALNTVALFVLAILLGALQPITRVGSMALLPGLVPGENLEAANSLWSFGVNLSIVAGPGIAGLLVAALGGPAALVGDSLTFAVMAAAALALPLLHRRRPAARAPLAERFGLRQLWSLKVVRVTTLLSLVFFFSYGPLEAALPVFSLKVLGTDARGYGLLWAALGFGALFGTLTSTWLAGRLGPGLALPLIALGWGVSLIPLAWTKDLWLACLWLVLGGLIWGPYTPMEIGLLQRSVPQDQLGRVFGARSTLLTSGSPLGLAAGGALLALLPSTYLILLSAGACILVGLLALASPALRGQRRLTQPPRD